MAQPKKKTSHQKQHSRRSKVWKATAQTITTCPQCAQPTRRHQACVECGYYRGRPARRAESVVTE
ncbi:MAG: 50S ribosomal protein L32 [Candidatus Obscuribacterales bacterium]|nr:50S ribosomal protein L32 [Candidatus Obscuribacterales bacterium]